jgi:hypothetical protein
MGKLQRAYKSTASSDAVTSCRKTPRLRRGGGRWNNEYDKTKTKKSQNGLGCRRARLSHNKSNSRGARAQIRRI